MVSTIVIGGGPAGLATAFWRRRVDPNSDVRIFESSDLPGGRVRSERRDGYLCEWGPQAVRPNPAFDVLVEALGCGADLVPAASAARTR